MLPARDAAPARTRLLTGPLGLTVRLNVRGACGWIGGLAAGGFVLGLTAKGAEDLTANVVGGVAARLGGAASGASYLGIVFLIIAIVVGLAAAGQVAATRGEEADGYLDHLLARPVARLSWLASRLAVSAAMLVASGVTVALFAWAGAAAAGVDQGLATLLAAGVNVVPADVFVLGAATLVYGVAPRAAVTTAYAIVPSSRPRESPPLSPGRSRSPGVTWSARDPRRCRPAHEQAPAVSGRRKPLARVRQEILREAGARTGPAGLSRCAAGRVGRRRRGRAAAGCR